MSRRVLVTNDDGIQSPGVIALAAMAQDAGYDVLLAAPHQQSSGSAAGLWRDQSVSPTVVPVDAPGLRGTVLSVAGHPGLIALLAMTGQFGPVPDVVLSGINDASNLGSGVLHSGTAGAAIVGTVHGAAAAAVSLYCDQQPDDAPRHWDTAIRVVAPVLEHIVAAPRGVTYNFNIPNVLSLDMPLVQADWSPESCVPSLVPFIDAFHAANGTTTTEPVIRRTPGTDIALVEQGYATVSAIRLSGTHDIPWVSSAIAAPQVIPRP